MAAGLPLLSRPMRALRLGDRGPLVWELQQTLRSLGFAIDANERLASEFGASTQGALRSLQAREKQTPSGELDVSTVAVLERLGAQRHPSERYRVSGLVRHADGSVAVGVEVAAYDVDAFELQPLGAASTDRQGRYAIEFQRPQFLRAERIGPDLIVRVLSDRRVPTHRAALTEADLAEVHYNTGPETRIDLVVDGFAYLGRSEWDWLNQVLPPLLERHGRRELVEHQFEFLSAETDIPRPLIEQWARAQAHSREAAGRSAPVSPEIFFAVERGQGRVSLAEIAAVEPRELRTRLERAQPTTIVRQPARWIDEALAALAALYATYLHTSPPFHVATLAGIEAPDAIRLLRAFQAKGRAPAHVWRTLEADARLAPSLPRLQRVFHLHTFSRGHLPLTKILASRFVEQQATSLGTFLSDIKSEDWRDFVSRSGAPASVEPHAYVEMLEATVAKAFPTHVVAKTLGNRREMKELARFFADAAEAYDIDEQPVAAWRRIETSPELRREAARVQRLHKVAGDARFVGELLDAGYRSAADVARVGESKFIAAHRDLPNPKQVFQRALRLRDSTILFWSGLNQNINPTLGPGLDAPDLGKDTLSSAPVSYCGCEECCSIYSPAAYLVDLLALTAKVETGASATETLRDRLYWQDGADATRLRRADLGQCELTCENTTRLLPHLDLVNEILEHVALGKNTVPTYQTTLTDDLLLLQPEHRLDAAYDEVAKAEHPWSVSLDVGVAESEAWLTALGVTRNQLANIASSGHDSIDLNLCPIDVEILGDKTPNLPKLYGLQPTQNVEDPLHPGQIIHVSWHKLLSFAKYFLVQTGLSQAEFLEHKASHPTIKLTWPTADCGLDQATIELSEYDLAVAARFVRVLRRTRLSIAELAEFSKRYAPEMLLRASELQRLAALVRIARRADVSLLEAMTWTAIVDQTSPEAPSLTRTLGVPIATLGRLFEFLAATNVGILSSEKRTPMHLESLFEAVDVLAANQLRVEDADYLLLGTESSAADLGIDRKRAASLLTQVRDEQRAAKTRPAEPKGGGMTAQRIATAFGLDNDSVVVLMNAWGTPFVLSSAIEADTAVVPEEGNTGDDYEEWRSAYRWIAKAALLASRLQLSSRELSTWLQSPHSKWLKLDDLPPKKGGSAKRFVDLLSVLRLARLRSWVVPGRKTLFELATSSSSFADFAYAIGEEKSVVVEAAKALGIAPDQLWDGGKLQRLRLALQLRAETTASVDTLISWATKPLTVAVAQSVADLVKSKTAVKQWPSLARPIANRLREGRRDALLAYVGSRDRLTPADVSARYLIDVEMTSCQLTTRIRQALNSVQLYLQRVSLGLESYKTANGKTVVMNLGDHAAEWSTWLSSYTTWRQARLTFLYPENELDLSLRPSSTPLYADFEKRLHQSEVTSDAVEEAFGDYVRQLDQIAHLETVALYDHRPDVGPWTTHFIARTRGTPQRYYYRSLTDLRRWSAWERLDLDIQGDHIIPVVHNDVLYLAWATFADKQEESLKLVEADSQKNVPAPKRRYEIELAWSERKAGRWSPKRIATRKLYTSYETDSDNRSPLSYTFHACRVEEMQATLLAAPLGIPGMDSYKDDLFIGCRALNLIGDHIYWGYWILSPCAGDAAARMLAALDDDVLSWSLPRDYFQGMWLATEKTDNGFSIPIPLIDAMPLPARVAHSTELDVHNHAMQYPPFVLDDTKRSYALLEARSWALPKKLLGVPSAADPGFVLEGGTTAAPTFGLASAQPFYHPYACELVRTYSVGGTTALVTAEMQSQSSDDFSSYFTMPSLSLGIVEPYPKLALEFAPNGAYSEYNWELFFYAPLRSSELLAREGRFEDALTWMHRIYDPRVPGAALKPEKAWRFFPFLQRKETLLADLMALLDYDGGDPNLVAAKQMMEAAIADWRVNPFEPFAVARYRISAFMRFVKRRYVELLIAYGDSLFAKDTIELTNQAEQVYQWAATVLGPRPEAHPSRGTIKNQTYDQLADKLNPFGNALVEIEDLENYVPTPATDAPLVPLPLDMRSYFCVPLNERLFSLWDTLTDRLWKIRHCKTIGGGEASLTLFGGTLDASILAQAKAAGLDLANVLEAKPDVPIYRFGIVLQKAIELVGDLRAFGSALLSTIEKRDAEALARLRQQHERALLTSIRTIKERQLDEARASLDALEASRRIVEERISYYGSREKQSSGERSQLSFAKTASNLMDAASSHELISSIMAWIPQLTTGVQGVGASPTLIVETGGQNAAIAFTAIANTLKAVAGHYSSKSNMAGINAGFERRFEDWQFQKRLAERELTQLDQQQKITELRIAIAEKDLANHDQQIQNSNEIDRTLRSKRSSFELYDRNLQALTALHEALSKLATAAAYRAQAAYRYERAELDATFIEPDREVGLASQLVTGERLLLSLRRMEGAFLEANHRDLELTRHVSLMNDFPFELTQLLEQGHCEIVLSQDYFDRDALLRANYCRRIKSVGLTIACPVGPYEPVHARLTLSSSKLQRIEDGVLEEDTSARPAFTTSRGLEDTGMFDSNLRDERLLWLEGAGVTRPTRSSWTARRWICRPCPTWCCICGTRHERERRLVRSSRPSRTCDSSARVPTSRMRGSSSPKGRRGHARWRSSSELAAFPSERARTRRSPPFACSGRGRLRRRRPEQRSS